jgi:hypothetical protein
MFEGSSRSASGDWLCLRAIWHSTGNRAKPGRLVIGNHRRSARSLLSDFDPVCGFGAVLVPSDGPVVAHENRLGSVVEDFYGRGFLGPEETLAARLFGYGSQMRVGDRKNGAGSLILKSGFGRSYIVA